MMGKIRMRNKPIRNILAIAAVGILSVWAGLAYAQELVVIGYNVESGGADPNEVAQRIARIDGCDIWGLSEVQNKDWADAFETACSSSTTAPGSSARALRSLTTSISAATSGLPWWRN